MIFAWHLHQGLHLIYWPTRSTKFCQGNRPRKLAQGSREKWLQIRIESQPETSTPYMGKTEVIPLLPNGSWPCELSPVTKSTQRKAAILTNTKRALSKTGPSSSCLEQAPVWENNTRGKLNAAGGAENSGCLKLPLASKSIPPTPKKWPTMQKEWGSQKQ